MFNLIKKPMAKKKKASKEEVKEKVVVQPKQDSSVRVVTHKSK